MARTSIAARCGKPPCHSSIGANLHEGRVNFMASVARRRLIGAFLCLATVSGLAGCTAALGAGAVAAVVAVGAVASRCYDYFDVTVLDAAGRKTCAATVTATNGRDSLKLRSCYYAALTDGHWTLRASLPGYSDALSLAVVDHSYDCDRHVQSVELTLSAPHQGPPLAPAVLEPRAPVPQPQTPVPAPSSSTEPSSAPQAAPASVPSSSALPTPSAPAASDPTTSSRGAFPDAPPSAESPR